MKWVKVLDDLPLSEVVDILSSLSELDLLLAVEKEGRGVRQSFSSDWTSEENVVKNEERLRSLLLGARHFLEHLAEKEGDRLKEPLMAGSIRSLMTFIHDAMEKVEHYTPLFKKDPGIKSLKDLQELRDLEEYYSSAIAPSLAIEEGNEGWEEMWGIKASELSEGQRRGLSTLSDVCSDRYYEMLYLLKEDGKPFYDYDMLKKAHMLYELDTCISSQEIEGLFYKIALVEDRRAHMRAQSLLKSCSYLVDEFFKEALKYKESLCVSSIVSALMALMVASNPRNLKQSCSSEKCADNYLLDFVFYMRQSLSSEEYQKLIMISHERRPFQASLYLLIHKLIFSLFTYIQDHKEIASLIRRMISEGTDDKTDGKNPSLKKQDRAFRAYLCKYPAGSLHKLSVMFERGENKRGFDPFMQQNLPEGLFTFTLADREIINLKIPSFCKQEYIQKAELTKEFDALMRSFSLGSREDKLLYIGLQDRTSWQDYARCTVLEEASKKEEYYQKINLFCLAKNTDFYHQLHDFFDVSESSIFIDTFYAQVMGREECGFFISEALQPSCKKWLKGILDFVHHGFFKGALKLTREERLDFIEIAYLMLIAMSLQVSGASLICFADKDGVDSAAALSALWYGLCALLQSRQMSDEQKSHMLYLLYGPALILRERGIDPAVFARTSAALDAIQKGVIENKMEIEKKRKDLPFLDLKLV